MLLECFLISTKIHPTVSQSAIQTPHVLKLTVAQQPTVVSQESKSCKNYFSFIIFFLVIA